MCRLCCDFIDIGPKGHLTMLPGLCKGICFLPYFRPLDQSIVQDQTFIFLFINQNICCGYSKEPSQWDGSFEHLKPMLRLTDKKIFTILRRNQCLSRFMLFTNFKGHVMRMLSNYAKLLAVKDGWLISHLTPELDCYKHPYRSVNGGVCGWKQIILFGV